MLDFQFSGPPALLEAPSDGLGLGADTYNNSLWLIGGNGNYPVVPAGVAKAVSLGQTANVTSLLVYTAPISGLYLVDGYTVATVATAGTLPSVNAAFTEADTGGAATQLCAATLSTSAANTNVSGSGTINAKAGTTITISTAGYATTTYNVRVRILYLGS